MTDPILSIYIPNYNHGAYLKECISSVFQEAPENTEVLIIDDASTDESLIILDELMQIYPKIRLIKHLKNQGANASLQEGLFTVKGTFSLALAADDKLLKGSLKKALCILKEHKDLAFCCSDYAYFYDETPEKIEVKPLLKGVHAPLILTPKKTLEAFQKKGFWVPGHTTIVKTSIAQEYGGYLDQLKQSSDFFLFHKIALNHPIAYLPEKLHAMRLLHQSFSAQCVANPLLRKKAALSLLDLILKDPSRDLFCRSTLLGPMLKRALLPTLLNPKYWRFYPPVLKKKLKRLL